MAIFQEFVTLKKAAEYTGYHPDYIGALVRLNKINGRKEGRNWYVKRSELEKHLSTKHYVPIEKAIIFSKKGMYFWGFFMMTVSVGFLTYTLIPSVHTDSGSQKITAAKQELTDTIELNDNGVKF